MLQTERHGPVTRFRLARRLPGLRPMFAHAFLVDGLLIDAGPSHQIDEFVTALQGRSIGQLVLTHHHEDHVGGAAALNHLRQLVPRIHPRGLPLLTSPPRLRFYERVIWGRPPFVVGEPLPDQVETDRFRFQVLHTPGHSPDHVVLYEPGQGWLFSGDLFIHPRLSTLRVTEDLPLWWRSLREVARLPFERLFCSHYGRVAGPAELREKIEFIGNLAEQAGELYRRGLPPKEIRNRLLGRENWLPLVTAGEFSKLNLVHGLLALDEQLRAES